MSNRLSLFSLLGLPVLSLCIASVAHAAYVDPPGRVARLNDVHSSVSYSPAGETQWVSVVRNRPLIRGDRLWTDHDARAELQIGRADIRLGSNTGLEVLDLDDRIAQVRMTQGTLNLRVRSLQRGQVYEVATPILAFVIDRVGRYRIDIDPRGEHVTIVVWEGAGKAYGEHANFLLRAGDAVRFYDSDLHDYDVYALPRLDEFDRYCLHRDRHLDRSVSLRYVGDDVPGYADLDEYGTWNSVHGYGAVWFPNQVGAHWAPYQDGHWIWQEPWGWTWVDDAPWGFAPAHYGRWSYVSDRWGWIPGPTHRHAVYAPALVVFIGGGGWNLSLSSGSPIGWFPLGPREVYLPPYQSSLDYFTQVNVHNTVVNTTTITNIYNDYSSGGTTFAQSSYANRAVAGAVTAVPSSVFQNAQSVRKAAISLDRNAIAKGSLTHRAHIKPGTRSVLGSATAAKVRPSREIFDRRVIARSEPSTPRRRGAAGPKVRVVDDSRAAVNVREAASRRSGGTPAARATLQPLDRSDEGKRARKPKDQTQDNRRGGRSELQQEQVPGRAGQAESEQQAKEQQRKANAQEQKQRRDEAQQQDQRRDEAQQQVQRKANAQQQQQRRDEAQQQVQRKAANTQEQKQRRAEGQQQKQRRDEGQQQKQRRDEGQQQAEETRKGGTASQKKSLAARRAAGEKLSKKELAQLEAEEADTDAD